MFFTLLIICVIFIEYISCQYCPNCTCGSWCDDVPESSSCGTGNSCPSGNPSDCIIIPDSECGPGNWSWTNDLINGDWIPSRSTHYGGTSGGACGYGNTPNCYDDNCADEVPQEVRYSPMAGNYAAPQGDYYAQFAYLNGSAGLFNYLSCGSCFELRCYDPNCETNEPIYLNIVDSCPCAPNVKWCCGNYSHCDELGPDLDGYTHCAVSSKPLWTNASIHLDLSDNAFGLLVNGNRGSINGCGVVNTYMRRVSCPVTGNVYIVDGGSDYNANCATIYPNPTRPCFYYLAINPYNVAGYGGITDVSINAYFIVNNQIINQQKSLLRNPNYPPIKPQEQFGNWVNKQNEAIFFPIQFIITDTIGNIIKSPIYEKFDSNGLPKWLDIGSQFPNITSFI